MKIIQKSIDYGDFDDNRSQSPLSNNDYGRNSAKNSQNGSLNNEPAMISPKISNQKYTVIPKQNHNIKYPDILKKNQLKMTNDRLTDFRKTMKEIIDKKNNGEVKKQMASELNTKGDEKVKLIMNNSL